MINKFSLLKLSKFFLFLAPFTVLVVARTNMFPFIVGKYFFFRVLIELALISFIWAWARGELATVNQQPSAKNKPQPSAAGHQPPVISRRLLSSPLVKAVSIFSLIFFLAGFFGYNPSASFWSNFERGEGGLQMLHLFAFFILMVLLFKEEKDWRKMIVIFIWAAVLMVAYGLAAAMGINSFIGPNLCARFAGSLGNPAYVGTYMIFALFFTAFLLNEERNKLKNWLKWLLKILLVVFFIILLFSQTRGAFLGLGVGVISGLAYFFFHLPKSRLKNIILAAIIILIIVGCLGYKFRSVVDLMPFCKGGGNRILDFSFYTETFQTRLLLWKQALILTKDKPFFGWGPENFSPAFEKHYNTYFDVWYDRAHNIFLDYLAQTGILGLLSYLGIFAVLFRQFFKKTRIRTDSPLIQPEKNKNQLPVADYQSLIAKSLVFALPIAYLVQGLVLFEVLPIYICLFIFFAFVNYKFNSKF